MRNYERPRGRFGAPGPFRIHTLLRAYVNDGTWVLNGDAAEKGRIAFQEGQTP
jgi:hypothetical protein